MVDLDRRLEPFENIDSYPEPPKKRGGGKFGLWVGLVFLLFVLATSTAMIFSQSLMPDWLYRSLPFVPHRLESIILKVGDRTLVCKSGEVCSFRPVDKVLIQAVTTDGAMNLGLEFHSPDFDPKSIMTEAHSFSELFPQLDFDRQRDFVVEVFWLRWSIGKVPLVVKWSVQDWLERARAAESLEKKEYFLSKALENTPDHVLIRNQLANIFIQQKKYSKAAEQYEMLLQQGQNTRLFMERLAKAYALGGNKDKAVEAYVELVTRFQEKGYIKEWLDYMKKSMSTKEIAKVARAYGDRLPETARSALLVLVSDMCASVKDWDCVAEYSEKALKSSAKSPVLAYNVGAALFQKKDYDKASEYLKKYLFDHPNDVEAHKMLALCYENLGQWAAAEEIYQKMVNSGHGTEDIIARWINTIQKTNNKAKLLAAYQKLSQLRPKDPTLWYNIGVLYKENGNQEESRKAFEKVVQLKPNDVNTWKYLREIYRSSKNASGEREVVKKLMSLEPNVESHYNDFFALSNKDKDYDDVVKALNTCINNNPKSVNCYNNLLYMYLKQKKEKEAAQVLEKLVELQPGKPELLLQAAKLLYNQKEYAKASDFLKRYLDKKPDDETAQDLYLEIRKKLAMQGPRNETGSSNKTTPAKQKNHPENTQKRK
ncbi:MAG: tetratricopeptide repeat protein [Thermodesulforhabdaceae bacterium]